MRCRRAGEVVRTGCWSARRWSAEFVQPASEPVSSAGSAIRCFCSTSRAAMARPSPSPSRRMTMQDEDRGRRGLLRRARGRTLASPTLRRIVGEAALETDVSRRPVLLDSDAHRDAAGRADRRAVVVGVSRLPFFHAISLARERNSYLPVPTPPPGALRRTFRPAVLAVRRGRGVNSHGSAFTPLKNIECM
jgi:hypothetical protein